MLKASIFKMIIRILNMLKAQYVTYVCGLQNHLSLFWQIIFNRFSKEIENLHSTDDGESSEQSKSSSNYGKLVNSLGSSVFSHIIISRSVDEDTNDLVAVFPFKPYY